MVGGGGEGGSQCFCTATYYMDLARKHVYLILLYIKQDSLWSVLLQKQVSCSVFFSYAECSVQDITNTAVI